jgi:hypothetical protein
LGVRCANVAAADRPRNADGLTGIDLEHANYYSRRDSLNQNRSAGTINHHSYLGKPVVRSMCGTIVAVRGRVALHQSDRAAVAGEYDHTQAPAPRRS